MIGVWGEILACFPIDIRRGRLGGVKERLQKSCEIYVDARGWKKILHASENVVLVVDMRLRWTDIGTQHSSHRHQAF